MKMNARYFGAPVAALLMSLAPPHARAAVLKVASASMLAPLKAFASAFNSGNRIFPSKTFTEDCTTIDEFDPFEWHGTGSIRVWYRDTMGGTTRGHQHFLAAHQVLSLGAARIVRQRGANAYIVLATRLEYSRNGTRRLQHLDWAVAERRTPEGWRIAAQTWALLDDTALQTATRIPFRVERGVIVFEARVNGGGPFDFVFDPGAQGTLTSLGAGLRQPLSLSIGSAQIASLRLPVYPGDPADIFRADPGAPPIAGALGPEILNRFAVRLDYGTQMMTLTPLESFVYDGPGVALPFTIRKEDEIPLVRASVDGIDGLFQYDVRAPVALFLFAPFLERSGLSQRYPAGAKTVANLTVAGTQLEDVTTRFGTTRTGKFGTAAEAGLLGYGVLSKFTTTIDYARKVIYFEP